MTAARETLVRLPPEQAAALDHLIASGRCRDITDVVAAGSEALDASELDDWIEKEVLPVVAASRADPSCRVTAAQLREALEVRREGRERGGTR